jgi:hypothetical protein
MRVRPVLVAVVAVAALAACGDGDGDEVSAGSDDSSATTEQLSTSTSPPDDASTSTTETVASTTTGATSVTTTASTAAPSTTAPAPASPYVLRQQLVYEFAEADVSSYVADDGAVCVLAELVRPSEAVLYEGCPPTAPDGVLLEVADAAPTGDGGWFIIATAGPEVWTVTPVPDTGLDPRAHDHGPVLTLEGTSPRFVLALVPPPTGEAEIRSIAFELYDRDAPQDGSHLGTVHYTLP